MQQLRKHRFCFLLGVGALTLSLTLSTGCDTAEAITALDGALNGLAQNKSLTEQFVRDIKNGLDPADPAYQQAMENYEEARDQYNHFLDLLELTAKANVPNANLSEAAQDAQNSTADFLAGATKSLRPNIATRRIPFQRAIVIPDQLAQNLKSLPKKYRTQLIDQFDNQVRWRSWRQL